MDMRRASANNDFSVSDDSLFHDEWFVYIKKYYATENDNGKDLVDRFEEMVNQIPMDKRFDLETRSKIRKQLLEKLRRMRYRAYKQVEREEEKMNDMAVFSMEENRTRIRSSLRIYLSNLMDSIPALHYEIVSGEEKLLGMDSNMNGHPHDGFNSKARLLHASQEIRQKLRGGIMTSLPRKSSMMEFARNRRKYLKEKKGPIVAQKKEVYPRSAPSSLPPIYSHPRNYAQKKLNFNEGFRRFPNTEDAMKPPPTFNRGRRNSLPPSFSPLHSH